MAATDKYYKDDEKKDFSTEEFAKAKTVCDFVIELTKAISRSGYYDANHPVSQEVKKGLYGSFNNALGSSSEIMLTCHDVEDKVDIHISGVLDIPFNIRKLTHATTSDLFVPKLKDYFERKSLNSFVIKKYITPEHFESFIDVMSEPIAESADTSKLGDYLTKALADLDITEVSTVFKTDVVLLRGKLPWRVSIILRRLAKDLKIVPMFRSASDEKMKMIKKQIVEDIIRPLNQSDLLRDLIVNSDVIVSHITHLMEVDELENLIISSIPSGELVDVSQSVFEVYEEIKNESQTDENNEKNKERTVYLTKVLNIAAQRILFENIPEISSFFGKLYEHKIIDFNLLPDNLRLEIQSRKLAGDILSNIDTYMEKLARASSPDETEKLILTFKAVMPEFIKRKEWTVIDRIIKALCEISSNEEQTRKSEMISKLPDPVFEGTAEIFADGYIQADKEDRNSINDILGKMKSMCINVIAVIFSKCKEPDVLKSVIELLSNKGELARQWALGILNDQNQPLSMLNIALLVIVNVGREEDINAVKSYVKHPNSSIRTKALSAVAKLNKTDASDIIMESLHDGEEKVRTQAANLIERELSLSGESINRLLLFVKDRIKKKNLSLNDAVFIAGLLKSTAKTEGSANKENLENELMNIVSDLLKERTGLLKFMKSEPAKEQMEIIAACFSTMGKIGGTKSKELLKTLSKGDTFLSKTANESMEELNKRNVSK